MGMKGRKGKGRKEEVGNRIGEEGRKRRRRKRREEEEE